MDNLLKEQLKDLIPIDYRIDQYNIYHVYFKDSDGNRYRYFLSGDLFQQWCYKNLDLFIIDYPHTEVINILQKHCAEFPFTLDLDSLYPR